MTRSQRLLLALIVAELVVGAVWILPAMRQHPAPEPRWDEIDPITAEELHRRIDARPSTADDWAALGEFYLAVGFHPEAEACLRVAVERSPDDAKRVFAHAFAQERLGRLEEADAGYRRCVDLGHRREDCHFYLGRNALRLNRRDDAIREFQQAEGLPAAQLELARLALQADHPDEFPALIQPLFLRYAETYPVLSLRYRHALMTGAEREQREFAYRFTRSSQRLPNPFDTEVDWLNRVEREHGRAARVQQAVQFMKDRRFAEAEAELRSAQAAEWSPATADQLAEVAFIQGRKEEAVRLLREAVDRSGPSVTLLARLGQGYAALNQTDSASAAWERGARLATAPSGYELWQDLVNLQAQKGERSNAEAARSRAMLLAGVDAIERVQFDQAVMILGREVSLNPSDAIAWYFLGEANRASRRPLKAQEAYERCLKIDPNFGRAKRALNLGS